MTNNSAVAGEVMRHAIRDHIVHFWENSAVSEERWLHGPIEENIQGFRVLKLTSRQPRLPVVFATLGCYTSDVGKHTMHEFFLLSRTDDPRHVETMTMLANFHSDPRYTLDVGSIVDIGGPWAPGSLCTHLLISVPYPYGPKLEWLSAQGVCVRFLWALPITQSEAAYAKTNGVDALEARFDAAQLDYLNALRAAVV
jgi:hypothetical protein